MYENAPGVGKGYNIICNVNQAQYGRLGFEEMRNGGRERERGARGEERERKERERVRERQRGKSTQE